MGVRNLLRCAAAVGCVVYSRPAAPAGASDTNGYALRLHFARSAPEVPRYHDVPVDVPQEVEVRRPVPVPVPVARAVLADFPDPPDPPTADDGKGTRRGAQTRLACAREALSRAYETVAEHS